MPTDARRSAKPRQGISFIELILVMGMIAILTGTGALYYGNLISQGNEERCRIDLRTFKKAIMKLETDQRVTIRPRRHTDFEGNFTGMEPEGLGVNDAFVDDDGVTKEGFHLGRLLDFRLITKLPNDPWGSPYQIDMTEGILYSRGPDLLDDSGDEIIVPFRTAFETTGARISPDRKSVTIDFSRKIDPFSLYAPDESELPFQLALDGAPAYTAFPASPGAPRTTTVTAARVITNPFAVVLRFRDPLPVPSLGQKHSVHILTGGTREVKAMDTGLLSTTHIELIEEY